MKLMEAVVNISEGRRREIIRVIANEVQHTSGVKLLNVDANADANRTVLTFAGTPQAVLQGAKNLFTSTLLQVDMRTQHGAHPRLGAVDVCPFVPLTNMTLNEVALLATDFAKLVAQTFHLPVYLYEACATTPERKNLAFLRAGEYESLPTKLYTLPPDFGPSDFSSSVQKTGASVIGARNFLLAFNISLNTKELAPAKKIASILREKNGGLKTVKAIGWLMPGYDAAQVSFNLTDFHTNGFAEVYETCKREARNLGLQVTGSELIGLAPEEAFLKAGRFYAPNGATKQELISVAVHQLGLNKIRPFVAKERILEEQLNGLF